VNFTPESSQPLTPACLQDVLTIPFSDRSYDTTGIYSPRVCSLICLAEFLVLQAAEMRTGWESRVMRALNWDSEWLRCPWCLTRGIVVPESGDSGKELRQPSKEPRVA
jgi:hypothetical protein